MTTKYILKALKDVNDPQLSCKTIHVTGTNGKGSTCEYSNSVLKTKYIVGKFTSPHFYNIYECIMINNKMITESEYNSIVNKYEHLLTFLSPFEILVFVMFVYFKDNNVDYAIIETGLGGLNDATNVISPLLCVITNVTLEHTIELGNTTLDILTNKAAIIKNNAPTFTTITDDTLISYLNSVTNNLHLVAPMDIITGIKGDHQKYNAALAYHVCRYLNIEDDIILSEIANTFLPLRIEYYKPNLILDGAHNIDSINKLCSYLNTNYRDKKIRILFSTLDDKPTSDIYDLLRNVSDEITYSYFNHERQSKTYNYNICDYTKYNYDVAENELLVVTGSFYFVSQVKLHLSK